MQRLRKFLHLGNSDRQLLVSAAFLLIAIKFGLWLLPFQTWQGLLARTIKTNLELQNKDKISVDKIAWMVNVASRYMPGGVKCLARALATQVLLGRYGHKAQIRLGVAKSKSGQLEAHAWVESHGRVVIGNLKDLGRYTPLPNLEGFRS